MRIALLASSFLPRIGGAELVVHNLAQHLQRLGHKPSVITWWGLWKEARRAVPYPVLPLLPQSYTPASRTRWEAGRGRRWPVAAQVAVLQALGRFDVWHIHMAYPLAMLATRVLQRMGVPVVITCHGDDLMANEAMRFRVRFNPHLDAALRDAWLQAAFVTAISPLMEAEFRQAGVPAERIRRVANGVECTRLAARTATADEVRRRHGVPEGVPLLVSVGRHHIMKGFQFIPEAVAQVRSHGREVCWLVVTDLPELVDQSAAAAGLTGWVRGVPLLPADPGEGSLALPPRGLIELYQAATAVVVPSVVEPFGNVIIEALAAGTPVLASDHTGCTEALRQGGGGLVHRAGDAQALGADVLRILQDEPLRLALARQAGELARNYDWPRIAADYVTVYRAAGSERMR